MRWSPRRSMLRLAPPIMIGGDAALRTALRAEGLRPFTPAAACHQVSGKRRDGGDDAVYLFGRIDEPWS